MEGAGRNKTDALSRGAQAGGEGPSMSEALDAAARTDGGIDLPEHAPRLTSSKQIDHESRMRLLESLAEEPWNYHFLALVRRLEALYHDQPGFGHSTRSDEDPVRFCQEPSLAFSPCTISEFKHQTDKAPSRLFVNFLGLTGPNGPLPLHLTEFARVRERHHRDSTLARFLDVFNHRMLGLFYRAWAASQMTASFDRWEPPLSGKVTPAERELQLARDTSRYSIYLGALFGMGMDSFRHRDAVPDLSKLHYAGRMSMAQKNPEGLRDILSQFFGVEVEVEEFHGRAVAVPDRYGCVLGVQSSEGAHTGQLGGPGGGAMCGSTYFDCAGAFRLKIGPLNMEQYRKLLPHTDSARRLATWIRNYVGDELWWDAVLVLKKEQVPRTKLGAGAALGWTTWIMSGESPEDRADLALRSPFGEVAFDQEPAAV
ncbi:MAG: type VI secretion system baseplate subunit TssG [Phycisphaerales bacterium]